MWINRVSKLTAGFLKSGGLRKVENVGSHFASVRSYRPTVLPARQVRPSTVVGVDCSKRQWRLKASGAGGVWWRVPDSAQLHTSTSCLGLVPNHYPNLKEVPAVTITEFIFENFDKYLDRPALIDGVTGETYTYQELRSAIYRVSSALTKHGVRKGDTLLIISKNYPEFVMMFHAALSVGATVTLANPAFLPNEVITQALNSNAAFVFAEAENIATVQKVCQEVTRIQKCFILGGENDDIPREFISFSELLADDGDSGPVKVEIDVNKDIAILPYSSGTTGAPKGVMISHQATIYNIIQFIEDDMWISKEGMHLGSLPFFHMFGVMTTLCLSFRLGQTVVTVPKFEPQLFLSTIEKYKCSLLFVVPPLVLFLSKDPLVDQYDLSSMSRLLCAAAPLREDLTMAFKNRFPNVCLGQGYGLTETGPALCINPVKDCTSKPLAAGLLLANTEAKFINIDTQEDCGINEQGELLSRGPQNMIGYYKNPDATAATVHGGWLHTGDIGYYDEDGHIYIVDRIKELIKYKGFQVAPAVIEDVLFSHPAVADAGVTAVPDDVAGELPRAYVALKPGDRSVTEEELVQYVAERVSSVSKLRGGVVFIDVIPRTASGKILRRELKEMARQSVQNS